MIEPILFYLFSLVLVFASVMTVSARNPVHGVLWMVLAFFNAATLFVTLGAEFLAAILLIVYVGAIAVLFLFVVMMLNIHAEKTKEMLKKEKPLALAIGGFLLAQMLAVVTLWPKVKPALPAQGIEMARDNTHALGAILYTDYALPFQISGLILLLAIVGAIVLALSPRRPIKRQNPAMQMATDPKEVVELVSVKTGEGAL
jgi:NADH-quinone oxidoreductase subunit J